MHYELILPFCLAAVVGFGYNQLVVDFLFQLGHVGNNADQSGTLRHLPEYFEGLIA